jgi:hypothetical protein
LQLNKNLPIFAANQSFNMQLKTLSFLLLANLVGSMAQAQSFQHSLGLSFNQMQYQRYSFQQYSQTRPPHVVTPMKEYNPIIPVRYHLRWGLGKRKEGQKLMLELNFPIDVALFATTDELKKADNFMMLHLPVLLGVCYGDRTKCIRCAWGFLDENDGIFRQEVLFFSLWYYRYPQKCRTDPH